MKKLEAEAPGERARHAGSDAGHRIGRRPMGAGDNHGSCLGGFRLGLGKCRGVQEQVRPRNLHGGGDSASQPVLNPLNSTTGLVVAQEFSDFRWTAEISDQPGIRVGVCVHGAH